MDERSVHIVDRSANIKADANVQRLSASAKYK